MAKGRRVVWSPAADGDLLQIWAYYARVASADVADNLLREIDRAGEAIGDNSVLSRDRADLIAAMRSVVVRPHVIFFLLRNSAVEIVRVLHGRRDFPAIFRNEDQ